ncbi:CHASE2 domain-containing protein [Leptolyngbya sp. AN03gr2]|uniref:CHASE2 domain-containing protein n=1 Tax=unclassified Leptolyngbya TaxID=2650499 RepID=UPI003D320E59
MPFNLSSSMVRQRLLRRLWNSETKVIATGISAAVATIVVSFTGVFQVPEWAILDLFFRVRPAESTDPRIVIITIDDTDISQIGTWPIPDRTLARILKKLRAEKPRAIGLDLYRDLPVEPGNAELQKVFRTTPNLIGVEKRFGSRQVPPPKTLAEKNQVAIVDRVEDADGRVRRDLISARSDQGKTYLSLGTRLSLMYLEAQGIQLESIPERKGTYRLGRATFTAFHGNDGGYIRADDNGYQALLNFRGDEEVFTTIPLRALLDGSISAELVRDRIILIGSTAESTNDFLLTPYDSSQTDQFSRTPGVFVHANAVSQMLGAALDGRKLIQVLPEPIEILWAVVWSLGGILLSRRVLQGSWTEKSFFYGQAAIGITGLSVGAVFTSYGLFLLGWWIPVFPAILGLAISTGVCLLFHEQDLHRLAYIDELTQVANRRYFEQQLIKLIQQRGEVSLVLCDVDFFKLYNDTYGHQAGDRCLMQVAQTLKRGVRRSDLVARYGGEEFAIILPETSIKAAERVANRILEQLRELNLPHESSKVSDRVTLSCGIASVVTERATFQLLDGTIHCLVERADKALYQSKLDGRDRCTVKKID